MSRAPCREHPRSCQDAHRPVDKRYTAYDAHHAPLEIVVRLALSWNITGSWSRQEGCQHAYCTCCQCCCGDETINAFWKGPRLLPLWLVCGTARAMGC